jgi:hypothetical protein
MSQPVVEIYTTTEPVIEVLDTGGVIEVILPGPQGPANTDYQIGGTEPTDPNIKIWYKLTGA